MISFALSAYLRCARGGVRDSRLVRTWTGSRWSVKTEFGIVTEDRLTTGDAVRWTAVGCSAVFAGAQSLLVLDCRGFGISLASLMIETRW